MKITATITVQLQATQNTEENSPSHDRLCAYNSELRRWKLKSRTLRISYYINQSNDFKREWQNTTPPLPPKKRQVSYYTPTPPSWLATSLQWTPSSVPSDHARGVNISFSMQFRVPKTSRWLLQLLPIARSWHIARLVINRKVIANQTIQVSSCTLHDTNQRFHALCAADAFHLIVLACIFYVKLCSYLTLYS